MEKGFNKNAFLEWLDGKFGLNSYGRELVEKVIAYGQKWERVALDQFVWFVSDMLPGVEFLDVARFCDDKMLSRTTLKVLGRI